MKAKQNNSDVINAIPELEENEQIVIEDTKRIRRERMPESPSSLIDSEEELIEVETKETPQKFSSTSIASLIFDDEPDELTNQFCTIHVRRKPDRMRDSFLTPCSTVLTLPAIQNVELTAERSDIEEIVRQQYGGGHYFFQIRFQNRLSKSWEASLADPPEAIAAARAEKHSIKQPAPSVAAQPTTNPLDQFFDTLKKQRELQDLLFGEERRRLEAEIERLRQEQQTRPAAPQSDLALLLDALRQSDNPGLIDFAREYLSGESVREPQFGVWDFLKYVFDHKDEIAPLIINFLGGGTVATHRSIEDVLRQQPPVSAKPLTSESNNLPLSKFRRNLKNHDDSSDIKEEANA